MIDANFFKERACKAPGTFYRMKIIKRLLHKRCFALCSAIQIFQDRGEGRREYSILSDLRINWKRSEIPAQPRCTVISKFITIHKCKPRIIMPDILM